MSDFGGLVLSSKEARRAVSALIEVGHGSRTPRPPDPYAKMLSDRLLARRIKGPHVPPAVTAAEARVRELEAQLAMAEAAAEEAGKLVARFRSQRDELRANNERLQEALGDAADALDWAQEASTRPSVVTSARRERDRARAALHPAPTDEDKS